MKALAMEDFNLASYGLLLKDTNYFSKYFSKLLYSHTKRDGNKAAHNLARFAINIHDFAVLMKDVSSHIYPVIQVDIAIMH